LYNLEYKTLFDFITDNMSELKNCYTITEENGNLKLATEFQNVFTQLDESEFIITNCQNQQYGNPKLFSILNEIYKS
jgi:hypothetical protein